MAKRKLAETGMHPNNPYFNNPPDFAALAELYPSLSPLLVSPLSLSLSLYLSLVAAVYSPKTKENTPRSPDPEMFVFDYRSVTRKEAPGTATKGIINFQDPLALRELTYCLLRKDFSVDLDIPIDSLCPPVRCTN
jgi:hypothetical protein